MFFYANKYNNHFDLLPKITKLNFVINNSQVKYNIKHLKLCLTDLNDNILAIVTNNIEAQRKQDRTTKVLISFVLVFGFVLLIAVFKSVSG